MAISLFQFTRALTYRGKIAPNILTRYQIPDRILYNSLMFHKYTIVDGDRPDTIAAYYYGSDLYDWVVMLSNRMVDLVNDWPLTQRQFDLQMVKQYGSLEDALSTVHHYEINTSRDSISAQTYEALSANQKRFWSKVTNNDGNAIYSITPTAIQITPDSFDILPGDEVVYWSMVTTYEYEHNLNEKKRIIQLIDVRSVPDIERSLRSLANNE